MGKGRWGRGQSCLAFLTRKPGREEIVPLSYLRKGTAFKPEFNITGFNLLNRGFSYTHLCAHTELLRARKNIPLELLTRGKRQSQSLMLSAQRGTSENREKAHCTDFLI